MSSILTAEYFDRTLRKLAEAEEAHREARSEAELALTALVQRLIPVGTMVDIDKRKRPEWLARVGVASGHPRGARIYEVATPPAVHIRLGGHVEMAQWRARAWPISGTSGKRLGGTDPTLYLSGALCVSGLGDRDGDDIKRMLKAALAAIGSTEGEPA